MKFCANCGTAVVQRVPPGDSLPRWVCDNCGEIHYQNPKLVVGTIPEHDGRLLLCRRAIEPKYGLWTVPAGFMEQGETAEQAAAREALEEAKVDVEITSLYAVFSIPHISQVYMIFRGRMRTLSFGTSAESLEVQLFKHADIPWDSLAFPVIHETLHRYVQDRSRGSFQIHLGVVPPKRK